MAKTYLITGGTSGIGEAVVRKLLNESCDACDKVIVTYGHNEDVACALKQSLSESDQKKLYLVKLDLSDRSNIDAFVLNVANISHHIDGLVLNIGVGTYKPFIEYEFEDWDRVIETNLTIPVFLIQRLKKGDFFDGSSIVLMGSLSGVIPYSSSVVYGISKAGLLFAAKTLVKELEDSGSRINAIAPGFIETRWQDGRSDESRERINRKIAVHRFGLPSEVADATYAVLSNPYINGTVLNVDGGYDYF